MPKKTKTRESGTPVPSPTPSDSETDHRFANAEDRIAVLENRLNNLIAALNKSRSAKGI